jgi:hypothetical protein
MSSTKNDGAVKAIAVLKAAGKGMGLNDIAKEIHWTVPNLKAKLYFGLKGQVAAGSVAYVKAEEKGKRMVFKMVDGKDFIAPVRKIRAKAAKVEQAPKAVKAAKVVEAVQAQA